MKSPGLKYPATHFQAQESDDFIVHCQINHPQAENFLCSEFERDLELSQAGQEFEENVYCDADPNSDEIILEQIDDSAHEDYGNTGCQVFKQGVQNWKDFCLKINIPKGNFFSFENWISGDESKIGHH